MAATTHDALALRLRDAYLGGVVPPLCDGLGPIDADGAYAVQEINTRFWQAQGRRIVGRKAGLTATVSGKTRVNLFEFFDGHPESSRIAARQM